MAKAELNKAQLEVIENDILNYIIEGDARSQIIEKIVSRNPKLKDSEVSALNAKCRNIIQQRTSLSAQEVINLHVIWYERLYKLFKILDHVPGQLAALRQKEKILGLLKEDNVIKIENELNVKVSSEVMYDVNKLTIEEQKRLEGYLKLV